MNFALMLVALLAAPLAHETGAEPDAYRFSDPAGDATQDGASATHDAAAATDVVAGGVSEAGGALHFFLQLADLGAIDADDAAPDYHVQYALSFDIGHVRHSMRASYSGDDRAALPLAERWSFQWHDQQADAWNPVEGRVAGDFLRWSIDASRLGASGTNMTQWGVQTWASYDDRSQVGDWAESTGGYIVGGGPWSPATTGNDALITDAANDVTSGGAAYHGADAAAVDILGAAVGEAPDRLVARLQLADLSRVAAGHELPGYHVQYALGFQVGDARHEFRATYRGSDMAPTAGWSFSMHHRATDAWPDVTGWIDGNELVWSVDPARFDATSGVELTDWTASAWASYDDRPQRNDHAQSTSRHVMGSGPAVASADPDAVEDVPGWGAVALLSALGVAAWARRR